MGKKTTALPGSLLIGIRKRIGSRVLGPRDMFQTVGGKAVIPCRVLCYALTTASLVAATVHAGAPRAKLVASSPDRFLTDTAILTSAAGKGARKLKLGDTQMTLPPHAVAVCSRGTISLVKRTRTETRVVLLDNEGWPTLTVSAPPSTGVTAFGQAVAFHPRSLHIPGVPYELNVVSAAGRTRIVRSGRTIVDIYSLEEHLVVTSHGSGTQTTETEIVNMAGKVKWKFMARSNGPNPRVIVDGKRALALYPKRPGSVLQISEGGTGQHGQLLIPGAVMTDVALLSDRSAILLWGPQDTALVDPSGTRLIWRTIVASPGKNNPVQLSLDSTYVTQVAGAIFTMMRQETATNSWSVSIAFFDVGTGSIIEREKLFDTSQAPTLARRFSRGAKERLVFDHRIYEVASK